MVTVSKPMFSCCLQRSDSWLVLPLTGLFTCSLRYTSRGPAVYAIFLTWPQDNVLELSSPTPSLTTQVRNLIERQHTLESPCSLGRSNLTLLVEVVTLFLLLWAALASLQILAASQVFSRLAQGRADTG